MRHSVSFKLRTVRISLTIALLATAMALEARTAWASSCRAAVYLLSNDIPRARDPDSKAIDPQLLNDWICTIRSLDRENPISLTGVPAAQQADVVDQARILLTKIQRAFEAFVQRPGAPQGQSEFNHITHAAFRSALRDATLEMFARIPATELVYFYFGGSGSGNSGRWVFHQMFDSIRDQPALVARVRIIEQATMNTIDPANVRRLVYLDDASYSGAQASVSLDAPLDRFTNVISVDMLIPYMTSYAKDLIRSRMDTRNSQMPAANQIQLRLPSRVDQAAGNIPTLRDIYNAWKQLPEAQRPIVSLRDMRTIFGGEWQALTLTYFDHKVADEISFVSFFSAGNPSIARPLVAGPVPRLIYNATASGFNLTIGVRNTEPRLMPFVVNYATTPYPNQSDADLLRGPLFRYPAQPQP